MERIDTLFADLVEHLESDPAYDVQAFLRQHPDEREVLRARLNVLRRVGLVQSTTRTSPSIRELRRSFGIELQTAREPSAAEPPADPGLLLPSRALGERYRTLGEIGSGGMGQVLSVLDLDFGRRVAMKLIRLPGAVRGASAGQLRRFLAEAQITGQLEHPGIVPVYDIGVTDDDQIYYTMKVVLGRTLHELIEAPDAGGQEAGSSFGLARRIECIRKVCATLDYAHSRGVVHRDLKPSNVMVGGFGEVLVMDWGIARVLGELLPKAAHAASVSIAAADPASWKRTETGEIFGTPSFMAPEQARGDEAAIGPATDVFGVGALLYQLLTGNPVYAGKTREEVIERATNGRVNDPGMLHSRRPVARELAFICRKALSVQAEDRYATAGELASDLEAYESGRVGSAWRDTPPTRLVKLVRRYPTRASVIAAVALLALLTWALATQTTLAAERSQRIAALEQARRDRAFREDLVRLKDGSSGLTTAGEIDKLQVARAYLQVFRNFDLALDDDRPVAAVADDVVATRLRGEGLFRETIDALHGLALQLQPNVIWAAWRELPAIAAKVPIQSIDRALKDAPDLVALWRGWSSSPSSSIRTPGELGSGASGPTASATSATTPTRPCSRTLVSARNPASI